MTTLPFQALSIILILISTYLLLWHNNPESAFIAIVFGSIVFFLGIRFEIKKRMSEKQNLKTEERKNNKVNSKEL